MSALPPGGETDSMASSSKGALGNTHWDSMNKNSDVGENSMRKTMTLKGYHGVPRVRTNL